MAAAVPRPPDHQECKATKKYVGCGLSIFVGNLMCQLKLLERYANTSEFPQKSKGKTKIAAPVVSGPTKM
jgi:hypothetical protein